MPDTEKENLIPPIGNKKVKSKKEAFCKFVEENINRQFIVCSHDNPDPDSLASAYGMHYILSFLGVESIKMFYCGEISHPQNRAMKTVLKIPINPWTKTIENEYIDAKEKPVFVFVDCVGGQKNMSIPFDPDVVVDHHKTIAAKGVLDIHDEIGACATLVVDLMLLICGQSEEKQIQCFDPDADNMREIATSLAVGIKTDTLDFLTENTTDDDFQAYKVLSRYFSDEKFHKIINYELPPYVFDAEQTAWENKNYQPPSLIAGLGFLDDSKSDCIPYLADKFMRLQGIQTVVVYAIVEGSVRGSVRTSSSTLDAQPLLDDLFGQGNGGAKHGIGGAKVRINVFDITSMSEEEMSKLWELVKTNIERKFQKITEK